MAQIDSRKRIGWHRRYRSPQGVKTKHEILRIFESGHGRITNSPAIRRLQQKTQVSPLERNAAMRMRLTHLMEIQQAGCCVARETLGCLKELKLLGVYSLDELAEPFENIVKMSCLMHDIGNPPFGHFGKATIDNWFRQRLYPEGVESRPLTDDHCSAMALRLRDGEEPPNALRCEIRQDLCHFEGGVQGIRLVYTLTRMNLTRIQVGGILKYTRPVRWHGETPETRHYLMKKPGYYLSEEACIVRLRKGLNLVFYGRFPLMWIMEATDDIFYYVIDLEDAVEKRIFTVEQLYHHLHEVWGQHGKGSLFSLVVKNAWEKPYSDSLSRSTEDQFFMYLQVNTLDGLVPYATQRFIDNLPAIFAGTLNHALLEDTSECNDLLKLYEDVAVKHVSSHPDVKQLELQGYRVIGGLLGIYRPLLNLSLSDFTELVEEERVKRFPIETRLSHKLSTHYRLAYIEAVNKLLSDSPEFLLREYYYRCCPLQDYISGVTDLYAWDEYRRLMIVKQ